MTISDFQNFEFLDTTKKSKYIFLIKNKIQTILRFQKKNETYVIEAGPDYAYAKFGGNLMIFIPKWPNNY